jgi:hypothetical protein
VKRSNVPARNQKRLIEALASVPKGHLVTDLSRREVVTQRVFFDALKSAPSIRSVTKTKKTSTLKSIKPT